MTVHYALALDDRLLADLVTFALREDEGFVAVDAGANPDVVITRERHGDDVVLVLTAGSEPGGTMSVALADVGPGGLVEPLRHLAAMTHHDPAAS